MNMLCANESHWETTITFISMQGSFGPINYDCSSFRNPKCNAAPMSDLHVSFRSQLSGQSCRITKPKLAAERLLTTSERVELTFVFLCMNNCNK